MIRFVIVLLMAILAVNTVSTNQLECPEICTDNYDPVCASDGKIYKEFPNDCERLASNCRLAKNNLQTYDAVDKAWCTSEFVEDIFTKITNLNLDLPACLIACPMIYSPVCVTNGQYRILVSNTCLLETYNCALREIGSSALFKVLRNGTC